jgi:hypothetical protein
MISWRVALTALGSVLAMPSLVHAGMPSLRLTDLAEMRLQSISFFLVGFLLCAGLIQLLWNWLRKDFAALPRLSYPKALGVIALWGLLFVLVLTMISGARELMTPGAWEKTGLTYRIKQAEPPEEPSDATRFKALDRLHVALDEYARMHGGRYPNDTEADGIPAEIRQLPGPSGQTYRFVGGAKEDHVVRPLTYEPQVFGKQPLVLWSSGVIRPMEWQELMRLLPAEKAP